MSSITGVNSNFGFEALAVAVNKKATDAQGEAVIKLLDSTVQSVQQINAAGAQVQASGSVGTNIDTYA